MADAEVPQTQKESDNMSIFQPKKARADDTSDVRQTESRINWNELRPIVEHTNESPYSDADRKYRLAIAECAKSTAENQTLRRENADLNGECNALHREVARLQAQVDALQLDNRTIRCFAQSLKTRVVVLKEACNGVIDESLKDAADEVKKELPQDDPVPAFLTAEMPSQAEG